MPTFTIKIAAPGTDHDGTPSTAGHMWFSIDKDGPLGPILPNSVGFAPLEEKDGILPVEGTVVLNDDEMYAFTYYTGTLIIDDNQYTSLLNFANDPTQFGFSMTYWAPTNSCIDFTWKALEIIGVNTSGFEGDLYPTDNADNADGALYQYLFGTTTGWQGNLAAAGGYDVIYGSLEGDTLTSLANTDAIYGGEGNDILIGGAQNDHLEGNNGNDTLKGGAGADLMIGGAGIDSYFIEGHDTIRDSGSNRLYYQGNLLARVFLRDGGTNTYRFMGDSNITLTFGSTVVLTLNSTNSVTFANQTSAADFANGADTAWRMAA